MPNESNSADRAVEAYLQGYIQGFTDLPIETIRELYPLREILSHINPTLEELAREAESVCEERLHNSPGGQLLAALFAEIANAETGTEETPGERVARRLREAGQPVVTGAGLDPLCGDAKSCSGEEAAR